MIPARKNALFTRWFSGEAQRRIFRTFGAVRVAGLGEVAKAAAERPVLIVSNHTAWWDPLVVLYLAVRVLRLDSYAMMDAENLEKLPFFGRVGAFGVDLRDPADGARVIRYAARLLDRPGRLVWVFPQGREVTTTARPLGFRGGSAEIARVAKKAVVFPVAIRYEHGSRPEPSLYVAFGAPLEHEGSVARARRAQEDAVAGQLNRINQALVTGSLSELSLLHERKPSRLAAILNRVLAWLMRPR